MNTTELKGLIRTIPDFPSAGILFRDITPVLASAPHFHGLIMDLSRRIAASGAEKIVGIESRGFIIGVPIAYHLGLPFIPARKAGKLPAETVSVAYSLEYGAQTLEIHSDSVMGGERIAIVDDLLATGGTAKAAAHLIEQLGGDVVGVFCAIELTSLTGRGVLEPYHVETVLTFD
jgi:adenine phosphoribosyltransferase